MTRNRLTMIAKKALLYGLALIATTSVLVIAGEPTEQVTLAEFLIPKAIAMLTFLGCIFFGRHAQRMGWFPRNEKPFNR